MENLNKTQPVVDIIGFYLQNYQRYLMGTVQNFYWETLKFNRWQSDFDKLLKFKSQTEAQQFLDDNPIIEKDYNAWITIADPEEFMMDREKFNKNLARG